jgi:hypothetical protein
VISRTVAEQQRALYWHRRRLHDREVPRMLLRETDQLMFWLEECLVQELTIVPGWLMPRLVALMAAAHPSLPARLGRERRPEQVMELVFEVQEQLMEQSIRNRRPAKIIPLFRQ